MERRQPSTRSNLPETTAVSDATPRIVGESGGVRSLLDQIDLAGPSSAAVLIVGETGTGKELVARKLHALSPRRRRPFIAVNCAAMPESLVESQLFGHEKGAFTGATTRSAGYFEQANGGTLFLDEISSMPPSQQAKLLRALQEGTIRPLGTVSEIAVDVRVIAAMNVSPREAIDQGRLRSDLFYRLSIFVLQVPPLREREEDVVRLARHFVDVLSEPIGCGVKEIDAKAQRALLRHAWPGNVRELRNAIEHALIVSGSEQIETTDLPPSVVRGSSPKASSSSEERRCSRENGDENGGVVLRPGMTISELKKRLIMRTLEATDHNVTMASRTLGISSRTLYNKIQEWNLARVGSRSSFRSKGDAPAVL